jgi:hypothetical protein
MTVHDPLCSGCNYCRPLEPCEVEECPNAAEYGRPFCNEHRVMSNPTEVALDRTKGAVGVADSEGLPAPTVTQQHGAPSEDDTP